MLLNFAPLFKINGSFSILYTHVNDFVLKGIIMNLSKVS